jgi:cold-inducible RNA-binding protein
LAKRLYVGGLPYETTDDELKDLFSEAGAVESAKVVTDRYSGRSRGFGFVEMTNDDEAQKAIDSMNGKQVGERTITVNEAKPMGERSERGGFGGGHRGGSRGGFGGGNRDRGGFGRQY